MSRLFLLALLLTADEQLAHQCFESALNDCRKTRGVFKNWAHVWARRATIENAIRLLRPVPDQTGTVSRRLARPLKIAGHSENVHLAPVTALAPFERFVFVMSVLECYSDQECRILLGCFGHDVAEARVRGLKQIGTSAGTVLSGTESISRAAAATGNRKAFVFVREEFAPTVDSFRVRSIPR